MVKCGVLFEVRTESLNITQTMFGFKWLNNYLKTTDIVNNVFGPKKTRIKLYNILALPIFYTAVKIGPLKQEMQQE
jgi:uncharacterized membrane protein YpjA